MFMQWYQLCLWFQMCVTCCKQQWSHNQQPDAGTFLQACSHHQHIHIQLLFPGNGLPIDVFLECKCVLLDVKRFSRTEWIPIAHQMHYPYSPIVPPTRGLPLPLILHHSLPGSRPPEQMRIHQNLMLAVFPLCAWLPKRVQSQNAIGSKQYVYVYIYTHVSKYM